jgi:hypothetical protein
MLRDDFNSNSLFVDFNVDVFSAWNSRWVKLDWCLWLSSSMPTLFIFLKQYFLIILIIEMIEEMSSLIESTTAMRPEKEM